MDKFGPKLEPSHKKYPSSKMSHKKNCDPADYSYKSKCHHRMKNRTKNMINFSI